VTLKIISRHALHHLERNFVCVYVYEFSGVMLTFYY